MPKNQQPKEIAVAIEETVESVPVEIPTELPAPAAAPPVPQVTTAEEWAARKGMLPKRRPVAAPFARKGAPLRDELNPLFEKYAQAKAHFSWPELKELTEAEFDAAVTAATTHIYR